MEWGRCAALNRGAYWHPLSDVGITKKMNSIALVIIKAGTNDYYFTATSGSSNMEEAG